MRQKGVSRSEARELRRYRKFYQAYPSIRESLSPEFRKLLPVNDFGSDKPIRETPSPVSVDPMRDSAESVSASDIITKLAFSHIAQLDAERQRLESLGGGSER